MKPWFTLLFLSFSICVVAQFGSINSDTLLENKVIVTHSKIKTELKHSVKNITVVDSSLLTQQRGADLSQILETVAGIHINGAYSNPALNKSIFVRGMSADQNIILINGMPALDPSGVGGPLDIRNIDIGQIAKIEVVKGAQSVLYGSDALGGVINIMTTDNDVKKSSISAHLSGGSFQTWGSQVKTKWKISDQFKLSAFGSYKRTDGISEALDTATQSSPDFDNDGYNRFALGADIQWNLSNYLEFGSGIIYSDYSSDTDNGSHSDGENEYKNKSTQVNNKLTYKKNGIQIHLTHSYTDSKRDFISSFGTFPFKGQFHNFDTWVNTPLSKKLSWTGGINFQDLKDRSTEQEYDMQIFSGYTNMLFSLNDRMNVEGGVRYNQNSEFGNNVNTTLGTSYWITSKFKLFGNYSTGFKTPTLQELYGIFGGNPNLSPETSQSYELAMQLYMDNMKSSFQTSIFVNTVKNEIRYNNAYFNGSDHTSIFGIEVQVDKYLNEIFQIQSQYMYLHQDLIRRPNHEFALQLNYRKKTIFASLRGKYVGSRSDIFEQNLDSYFIINTNINYNFSSNLTVSLRLNNLLNADFEEIKGYSTPGINGYLTLNIIL